MEKGRGMHLPLPTALLPPPPGQLDGPPILSNYTVHLHPPLPESWVTLPSLLPLQSHRKEQVVEKGSVNKYKAEFVEVKVQDKKVRK